MRKRWKLLGGAGIAGVAVVIAIVGHSRRVKGDTETATVLPPGEHEAFTPWDLGPGAIPYDQLSADDKAGVDGIQQTLELGQPAASYQGFSTAVDQAIADSQAQLAARQAGLVGADQQGVV